MGIARLCFSPFAFERIASDRESKASIRSVPSSGVPARPASVGAASRPEAAESMDAYRNPKSFTSAAVTSRAMSSLFRSVMTSCTSSCRDWSWMAFRPRRSRASRSSRCSAIYEATMESSSSSRTPKASSSPLSSATIPHGNSREETGTTSIERTPGSCGT